MIRKRRGDLGPSRTRKALSKGPPDEPFGFRHNLDGSEIRLFGGITPGHEPVLVKNNGMQIWVLPVGFPSQFGHAESWSQVWDEGNILPIDMPDEFRTVRSVGERADRIRMRVIDMGCRYECMQQGLYGGLGCTRLHDAMALICDHLLVRHFRPFHERQQFIQPKRSELFGGHGPHIGPAALHPQDANVASQVVPRQDFCRRVSSAPKYQLRLLSNYPSGIHQRIEPLQFSSLLVRPTIQHKTLTSPWTLSLLIAIHFPLSNATLHSDHIGKPFGPTESIRQSTLRWSPLKKDACLSQLGQVEEGMPHRDSSGLPQYAVGFCHASPIWRRESIGRGSCCLAAISDGLQPHYEPAQHGFAVPMYG